MLPTRRLVPVLFLAVATLLLGTTESRAAFLPPGADFNGDGVSDLAIGAPDDSVEGRDRAGAVNVLYGGADGITVEEDQQFTQAMTPIRETPETGDRFGAALATGDFDDDGYDDLAIGVPGEGVPTGIGSGETNRPRAGLVHVLYGSDEGLRAESSENWTQDSPGIKGRIEPGDEFGFALAAGDFDDDGRADLGIGVPLEGVDGVTDAGAVNVIYGSSRGLTEAGDQLFTQNTRGIKGQAGRGFHMGEALATGDLSLNGVAELAIGIPGGTIGGAADAGAVLVLYGRSDGLSTVDDLWSQDSQGVGGGAEPGDTMGHALAIGDFDSDSAGDLAIGVPGEALGGTEDAGAVNVLRGSNTGLTSAGEGFWCQSCGLKGGSEAGDRFGAALEAVDFSGNVADDLAVGVPGEAIGDSDGEGAVNLIYGNRGGGLATRANQFWCQDCSGVKGIGAPADQFGFSLTAGDFDADNTFDLAIGVPGDDAAGSPQAGAVNIIPGSHRGLTERGDRFVSQATAGIEGAAGPDRFGASVASGSR